MRLRAAANTAREHRCRTLQRLNERLRAAWPGRGEETIREALRYWTVEVRRRYPSGPPRH